MNSQMASPIDTYLETRVLNAGPAELLDLLYGGAVSAVRNARLFLARGDIAARSREIGRAQAILIELAASLDHARAPELSARLADLYGYIGARLADANVSQADAPLAEALSLLTTLHDGWKSAASADQAA